MASTLNDVISAVRVNCGDPAGTSYWALTWTALKNWANQACLEICKRTGIIEDSKDFTTVVGDWDYPVADTTYLRALACEWNNVRLKPLSWNLILKEQGQDVSGRGGEPTNGSPEFYCMRRGELIVYPPPDTAGETITLHFVAASTEMTAGSSVLFYHSTPTDYEAILEYSADEAVIKGMETKAWGAMAAEDKRRGNIQGAQFCLNKAKETRGEFYVLIKGLEHANGPYPKGEVEYFPDED